MTMSDLVPAAFGNLLSRTAEMKSVLDLAKTGMPEEEIAAELGMTESRVSSLLKEAVSSYAPAIKKNAEMTRAMMVAQIDDLYRTLRAAFDAAAEEKKAVAMEKLAGSMYRGMAMKSQLLGLDRHVDTDAARQKVLSLPWHKLTGEEMYRLATGAATAEQVFGKHMQDEDQGEEEG